MDHPSHIRRTIDVSRNLLSRQANTQLLREGERERERVSFDEPNRKCHLDTFLLVCATAEQVTSHHGRKQAAKSWGTPEQQQTLIGDDPLRGASD
eukprot:756973-Hanusia_phi.AAC.3